MLVVNYLIGIKCVFAKHLILLYIAIKEARILDKYR